MFNFGRNNLKYFLIIVITVLIVIIGFLAYRISNKNIIWKSYKNDKYNLIIEYPYGWHKFDSSVDKTILMGITFSPFNEKQLYENGGALFNILPVRLTVDTNREFAEKRIGGLKKGDSNIETELIDTFLFGIPAVRAEIKKGKIAGSNINNNPGPEGEVTLYWFTKDDMRFEVKFIYSIQEKKIYIPIFNRMLSTFKFLD